ncbi:BON domain-containing protein [Burkholderia sp. Ac-20365]|uniref:BON domain-containing protein n=1 Tax=Burkholderia sp. Ac-20365 TaxID=2703897 RepID=UPI00197B4141|nr:BON domain-containing protein [Burkholderia sp. Ac-20365]MBN3764126.1 BON domain-containing protein [Burkholderia sp. Ac-20365]
MNVIRTLKLAGAALTVFASVTVWAQDSGTAASAPQTTSKKAVRKADRALSRKVQSALSKGGIDTSGINVLVKPGGAVTLAGGVTDPTQVDKATSIAKGVSGVTSVKNALTIREGGQ